MTLLYEGAAFVHSICHCKNVYM